MNERGIKLRKTTRETHINIRYFSDLNMSIGPLTPLMLSAGR